MLVRLGSRVMVLLWLLVVVILVNLLMVWWLFMLMLCMVGGMCGLGWVLIGLLWCLFIVDWLSEVFVVVLVFLILLVVIRVSILFSVVILLSIFLCKDFWVVVGKGVSWWVFLVNVGFVFFRVVVDSIKRVKIRVFIWSFFWK